MFRKALMVSRTVDIGQSFFRDTKDRWDRTYNAEKRDKYKTLLPTLKSVSGGWLG